MLSPGVLSVSQPLGSGALQIFARDFATDGFALVAPEDRGNIDQAASSEHRWLAGRWQETLADEFTLTLTARTYRENRNNGTPYQQNGTREDFASLAVAGRRQARGESLVGVVAGPGQPAKVAGLGPVPDVAEIVARHAVDERR